MLLRRPSSRPTSRLVAALTAAALLAVGTVAGVGATAADAATSGSVKGRVFQDFNGNGAYDAGSATGGLSRDRGVAGVAVSAVDALGASVGSATTAADGTYTLAVADAFDSHVRVAFATPSGSSPSKHGADNGTSVQFVTVGDTGVDYALASDDEYAPNNAPVVTAIQYAGLRTSATTKDSPSLVAAPWGTNFQSSGATGSATAQQQGTYPGRTTLGTLSQTGSLWGTAYSRQADVLVAAATYKRHADLGPLGLGGLYIVRDALAADGSIRPGASVQQWLDLSAHGVDVGTAATTAARGIAGPAAPAADVDGFAQAAKVGIGGLTFSSDGRTLYLVNLKDRRLYSVDLATETVSGPWGPVLPAGQRPWALTVHDGSIYLGVVDSGEAAPGTSASDQGAKLHVLRAAESAPTAWTEVLGGALGYTKGEVIPNTDPHVTRWNSWVDTWNGGSGATAWSVGTTAWGDAQVYPQAVLTTITFDTDGYMVLGLADRTGIQGGNRNHSTLAGDTKSYETVSSGDILTAAPAGGVYTLEANGVAGTRTGASTASPQGPGGREFFNDAQNKGAGGSHNEVTLGSVTTLPGVDGVVSTAFDPLNAIRVAGLMWFSTTNGAAIAGYEHLADAGGSAGSSGTFQKGGGLGDIEALAAQAPVEIGDRVWFDADQDGVQDADEPSVAGVTVELWDGATKLATKVTGADGTYYFSTADVPGFDPDGSYTVKVVLPSTGNLFTGDPTFGTVPWSAAAFTTAHAGSDDGVDSDASSAGVIPVTVGGPGENDHGFDAGLVANVSFTVAKQLASGSAAPGSGQTFALSAAARDFRGQAIGSGPAWSGDLAVGGSSPSVTLPVGSRVKVTESGTYKATTLSVAPARTPDADGYYALTGAGTAFAFTMTNTLFAPGTFSVAKTVSGDGSSLVAADQDFTVQYSTDAGTSWHDLTVERGGSVTSPALPYGSSVLVREGTRPVVAGVQWQTPSWTVDGGVAATQDVVAITIGDGTDVSIALDNPTTRDQGGISLTKTVSGGAAASVPNGFHFLVDATWTNPVTGGLGTDVLDVTKASPADSIWGLPYGTVVTLTERARTGAPADVSWGDPVWSGTGVTSHADGSATVTIGSGLVAVGLTNPTTQLTGDLSVLKTVTGPAAASAPTSGYQVVFSVGGSTVTKALTTTSSTVLEDVPAGTVVTLSEGTRPAGGPDLAWETPVWTGAGVHDNGDGTATVTVVAGSTIAIRLENPTDQLVDGFSVTKDVTGDAAASVPATFGFTVDWDRDGVAQTAITLTKAVPTQSFSGLPRGTVVTLREVTPTGAPADVSWRTPVWSGTGVTTNPDGSATFTIGSSPVAVGLENPTTRLFGGFRVTKHVVGEGTHVLQGHPAFDVTYTVPGESPTTRTITDGGSFTVADLPAGTVVDLSEATPTGGLPAGASWGTPRFLVDGHEVTHVTVKADETVEVVLENPTTVTPAIDVEKGDGAGGTILHDADTMADGEHYAPGEKREIDLVVTNTGTERLREVTLRDDLVSGDAVTAITWTFPDGSTATAVRDGDAWVATWPATFGSGTASFAPGETITGVASLTVTASAQPHVDVASVTGVGIASGTKVRDEDAYDAFTGAIQVIKYDGASHDPQVRDGDDWVVPTKPLVDAAQDAQDAAHAVAVASGTPHEVRWVVTNTGTTTLTDVDLADTTAHGPEIASWTCDLSPFGGPKAYDFVADGTWHGELPPNASFFCTGDLTLEQGTHADTVDVEATVVVPAVDAHGKPTGEPSRDADGALVTARHDDGTPVRVADDDPFHAKAAEVTTGGSTDPDGTKPTPKPDGGALATTGAQVAGVAGLALLVLLGGVLALVWSSRRRSRA
ncbi:DUF5979 domain-containing protein [Cellulomonas sp. HZM]|uniref:DUF5979 domain-containing protein n=1 Tax=Cellulomonas sp. HZM TaxID=1454010 RepID=UPI000AADAD08|nr:DUF5979 domain-containing protein [Cellulomonas sp. HZM]